jgi:hypothetical protein
VTSAALIPVYDEFLEVQVHLPLGWDVVSEADRGLLTCVAPTTDQAWQDYRPSITVEVNPSVPPEHLATLADQTLEDMRASYEGFELLWRRTQPGRLVRAYAFDPRGLGLRVRQVQGLVGGPQLLVVNCTEALQGASLEDVFTAVIASAEPTGHPRGRIS